MSESSTASVPRGTLLWPLAIGSLLLGFAQTITWRVLSVTGWTDGTAKWDYLRAAVEVLGWLLVALAAWQVARSQRYVAQPWGDAHGLSVVAIGIAITAFVGLIRLGEGVVGTLGPFSGEGLVVRDLFKADAGIIAVSFTLSAFGARAALRASLRADGIELRWARPWRMALAGVAVIALGSLIEFGASLVVTNGSWNRLVYAYLALVALGWLVVGLAAESFRRVATGNQWTTRSVAFHLGAFAAFLFAVQSVVSVVTLHEGSFGLPSSLLYRWLDVFTLVGWLCVTLGAFAARESAASDQHSSTERLLGTPIPRG
jgi:hypothetical protein